MTRPGAAPEREARWVAARRREIDRIDGNLVDLLARRGQLVLALGRFKRERSLAPRQVLRERQVLEQVSRKNPGPYPDAAVRRIWKAILAESVRLEAGDGTGPEHRPAGGR